MSKNIFFKTAIYHRGMSNSLSLALRALLIPLTKPNLQLITHIPTFWYKTFKKFKKGQPSS